MILQTTITQKEFEAVTKLIENTPAITFESKPKFRGSEVSLLLRMDGETYHLFNKWLTDHKANASHLSNSKAKVDMIAQDIKKVAKKVANRLNTPIELLRVDKHKLN